jgi:anion-transporting  ArsA/GET3 family ATPase
LGNSSNKIFLDKIKNLERNVFKLNEIKKLFISLINILIKNNQIINIIISKYEKLNLKSNDEIIDIDENEDIQIGNCAVENNRKIYNYLLKNNIEKEFILNKSAQTKKDLKKLTEEDEKKMINLLKKNINGSEIDLKKMLYQSFNRLVFF